MSLNFGYRKKLNQEDIPYFNKLAKLQSRHQILLTDENGATEVVTAKHLLIATGGRPSDPGIPGGQEHSITSDDIFWLKKSPGRTLVVGASYIAL